MRIGYSSKVRFFMAILLASGALLARTVRADDEYRDFEDVEGRTIRGKVVAFDDAGKMVTFQRESDGKVLQVKLIVFSQPDRQYIRDWAYMANMMKYLKINANIEKKEHQDRSDGTQFRVVSTQWFNVEVENVADHDFGQISLKYCIFYRQGLRKEEGMVYDEGTCHGEASIQLKKGQKQDSFKTKTIELYSQQSPDTYFGRLNDARGEIRGIWIKARLSLPSGERFSYEFRSSQDPKWKWSDTSIPIGMNRTADK